MPPSEPSSKSARAYEPLGGKSHDATFNTTQLQVDAAARAILAVLRKPWTCNHCGGRVPKGDWLNRRLLMEAADRHYQEERGTKYEGLSSSVYYLATLRLVEQGFLEDGWTDGVRLV